MTYVSFVPPGPPSPRTHELGRRLADTISQFRRENPDVTELEITHAFQLAKRNTGMRNKGVLIGVLIALVASGIAAFLLLSQQLLLEKQSFITMIVITAGILFLTVLIIFRNR